MSARGCGPQCRAARLCASRAIRRVRLRRSACRRLRSRRVQSALHRDRRSRRARRRGARPRSAARARRRRRRPCRAIARSRAMPAGCSRRTVTWWLSSAWVPERHVAALFSAAGLRVAPPRFATSPEFRAPCISPAQSRGDHVFPDAKKDLEYGRRTIRFSVKNTRSEGYFSPLLRPGAWLRVARGTSEARLKVRTVGSPSRRKASPLSARRVRGPVRRGEKMEQHRSGSCGRGLLRPSIHGSERVSVTACTLLGLRQASVVHVCLAWLRVSRRWEATGGMTSRRKWECVDNKP